LFYNKVRQKTIFSENQSNNGKSVRFEDTQTTRRKAQLLLNSQIKEFRELKVKEDSKF
jgi:hypothetical protein